MNQRDFSEIKRRLNPDHRNPTIIRGCYVSGDGQVISSFMQAVGSMAQDENEKYMALFRRTLSGAPGQNLLPIDFSVEQVNESEEYRLLDTLVGSALTDENAVDAFCQRVIGYVQDCHSEGAQSVDDAQNEANYLVLMLHDGYDIPFRDTNGEIDRERSLDVLRYMLCCVCPVKRAKPALRYIASEGEFHSRESDWVVGAPDLGFMFPAYEERGANISRAIYYTRDASDLHEGFVQRVFNAPLQMNAAEQKETFQSLLRDTLQEECSLNVMQQMHETVSTMIEEQKADKTAEPLTLSKREVKKVLEECGVSEEKAAAFEERYEEAFGEKAQIAAVNIIEPKQFRVSTPSVSIKVDPDHSDLIETRVIDGKCYIMILCDGEVEVNGMQISG